jgi:NAD(P)-dependent dehydrogenase (short-subunit alcohol dehydrogenase family)
LKITLCSLSEKREVMWHSRAVMFSCKYFPNKNGFLIKYVRRLKMKKLNGKTAIVTGGASGIGKAYCSALAREGASVVIADTLDGGETAKTVAALDSEVLVLNVNVTEEESTQKMASTAFEKFGRIDILVNNAGIYPVVPFKEMTLQEWKEVLAVNLDGIFLSTKAVLSYMIEQKSGRIINISSASVFTGTPGFNHYVTSKAGVIGFTRSLATELGDFGITVNAIAPGLVATETALQGPLSHAFEPVVERQVIKRREEPEDLAGALLFLASDDSAFVTGQTISVDGGLTRR